MSQIAVMLPPVSVPRMGPSVQQSASHGLLAMCFIDIPFLTTFLIQTCCPAPQAALASAYDSLTDEQRAELARQEQEARELAALLQVRGGLHCSSFSLSSEPCMCMLLTASSIHLSHHKDGTAMGSEHQVRRCLHKPRPHPSLLFIATTRWGHKGGNSLFLQENADPLVKLHCRMPGTSDVLLSAFQQLCYCPPFW